MNSWYFEAPDGRRFNWNKAPTYICPNADPIRVEVDGDERIETITLDRAVAIDAAARGLMMDPLKLARLIKRSHRSFSYQRERVNGKLTDRCECCGAKMDRLGFRCWVDRPKTEDELTSEDRTSSRVAERLGFDPGRRVVVHSFYADTKREADAWARDELRTAKAVAAEGEQ